jgi:hypothetical protein
MRQICNLIPEHFPEHLVRCGGGGWFVAGTPFWEEN